ncbi:MAG: GNAT family protein [Acidobacteriota bacterium]
MEGCVLRIVEKGDIGLIKKWVDSPQVLEFIQPRTPLSEEEVSDKFLSKPSELKSIHFMILSNGVPAGVVSLKNLHFVNRRAEMSIFIGEDEHRGKGIGKAATVEALRFAFRQLNLHKVALEVYDFNTRAIELYKRLGFKIEGVLRSHSFKNGRYRDLVLMGLLREEFEAPA